MRFFTSLRYVQNDNTLVLKHGGMVAASPPPCHHALKTLYVKVILSVSEESHNLTGQLRKRIIYFSFVV